MSTNYNYPTTNYYYMVVIIHYIIHCLVFTHYNATISFLWSLSSLSLQILIPIVLDLFTLHCFNIWRHDQRIYRYCCCCCCVFVSASLDPNSFSIEFYVTNFYNNFHAIIIVVLQQLFIKFSHCCSSIVCIRFCLSASSNTNKIYCNRETQTSVMKCPFKRGWIATTASQLVSSCLNFFAVLQSYARWFFIRTRITTAMVSVMACRELQVDE